MSLNLVKALLILNVKKGWTDEARAKAAAKRKRRTQIAGKEIVGQKLTSSKRYSEAQGKTVRDRERHFEVKATPTKAVLKSMVKQLQKNKKYSEVSVMDSLDGSYIQALHKGGAHFIKFKDNKKRL